MAGAKPTRIAAAWARRHTISEAEKRPERPLERLTHGERVLAQVSHEFLRDDNLPLWHGFHAFRRGLATSLYDLGVDDFMIQQIPRQADVETTRRHYIKA